MIVNHKENDRATVNLKKYKITLQKQKLGQTKIPVWMHVNASLGILYFQSNPIQGREYGISEKQNTFEKAKKYRKSLAYYLRLNQWEDITIDIYL